MRFDLAIITKEAKPRAKVIECRAIEAPLGPEASYRRVLYRLLFEAATFVRETILPAVEAERTYRMTVDAAGDRMGTVFGMLRTFLERLSGIADDMVRRILDTEADRHTTQWQQRVREAVGIDLAAMIRRSDLNELLSLAAQRNADLIKSLSDDVVKRVSHATLQNLVEGGSAKDLQRQLTGEFGVARERAKLIARDQTAKLNSDMTRFRQLQAGVDRYRWSTSRDERVRPTHRANEGKIFEWSDPPAATGHPGHDVNCRCVAIALIEVDGAT